MEERNKDDPRLEFFNFFVQKSLRIKGDKWQKLITSDDRVNKLFVPFPMTVPVDISLGD